MADTQMGDIRVTFPSQNQYIHLVTMVARNAASVAGFSDSVAGKIAIATDEAVTNVIKHAYKGKPGFEITLSATITPESLILQIRHTGEALTKDAIKLPIMKEYIRDRRVGGLGLYIINQFMDEVDYLVGKEHCCQMTKYRNKDAADKRGQKNIK